MARKPEKASDYHNEAAYQAYLKQQKEWGMTPENNAQLKKLETAHKEGRLAFTGAKDRDGFVSGDNVIYPKPNEFTNANVKAEVKAENKNAAKPTAKAKVEVECAVPDAPKNDAENTNAGKIKAKAAKTVSRDEAENTRGSATSSNEQENSRSTGNTGSSKGKDDGIKVTGPIKASVGVVTDVKAKEPEVAAVKVDTKPAVGKVKIDDNIRINAGFDSMTYVPNKERNVILPEYHSKKPENVNAGTVKATVAEKAVEPAKVAAQAVIDAATGAVCLTEDQVKELKSGQKKPENTNAGVATTKPKGNELVEFTKDLKEKAENAISDKFGNTKEQLAKLDHLKGGVGGVCYANSGPETYLVKSKRDPDPLHDRAAFADFIDSDMAKKCFSAEDRAKLRALDSAGQVVFRGDEFAKGEFAIRIRSTDGVGYGCAPEYKDGTYKKEHGSGFFNHDKGDLSNIIRKNGPSVAGLEQNAKVVKTFGGQDSPIPESIKQKAKEYEEEVARNNKNDSNSNNNRSENTNSGSNNSNNGGNNNSGGNDRGGNDRDSGGRNDHSNNQGSSKGRDL